MNTDLSSPVATAEFSKFAGVLSAALSQHHLLERVYLLQVACYSACHLTMGTGGAFSVSDNISSFCRH